MRRISSTNYYWDKRSDYITIYQRKRWLPAILCSIIISIYSSAYLDMNKADQIPQYVIILLISFSPWLIFNLLTPVSLKIYKDSIIYNNPVWKKHKIVKKVIIFETTSKRVGGNYPHQEIKIMANFEDSSSFMLLAVKKYGVEEDAFNELVNSLNALIKQ